MGARLLAIVGLSVTALMSTGALADTRGLVPRKSAVLWKSPTTGKWTSSRVWSVASDGLLEVSEHVFKSELLTGGRHQEKYWLVHESQVIRELPDRAGIGSREERCLAGPTSRLEQGTRVRINHVFANHSAEVERGGLTGTLLRVFQFPEVVALSALKSCEPAAPAKSDLAGLKAVPAETFEEPALTAEQVSAIAAF
ncbi:MAG: hypothetical protein NDJ89_13210 [Oligoflexia bacterium]|nr:hypothetical protein [Oligoflexia bacterium]